MAVLANDADVDGDALVVSAVGSAAHGAVTTDGATVTYTPNLGFAGSDSFAYTVSDPSGATASAQVAVTVQAVNTPPAAANDAAVTDEDTPVTVAVLANDTDGDGDALTVTAAGPASNGNTATDGVTVSYTPKANFHGVELLHVQRLRRAGRRGLGPGRRHGQPGQRPAHCLERCG